MKLHELKIKCEYLKEVQEGRKTFELRKNDRDYQVGDLIKFNCIDGDKCITAYYNAIEEDTLYRITYVLKNAEEYGLDFEYCILGIKKVIIQEVSK